MGGAAPTKVSELRFSVVLLKVSSVPTSHLRHFTFTSPTLHPQLNTQYCSHLHGIGQCLLQLHSGLSDVTASSTWWSPSGLVVQLVPAHSLRRQTENLCVKLSSSHMKCNCSEQTDVTNRRTISSPISTCIRWWNSCRPHNPRHGYNQPQSVVPFMTEISFCWCFHPLYCHQVTPAPYSNVTPFQFQFLGP